MSSLPTQTPPVFATDDDEAIQAGGDFVALFPPWQGSDQSKGSGLIYAL